MVKKAVALIAIVIVIALLIVYVVLPAVKPPGALSTTLIVVGPDGKPHVIFSDAQPLSVVSVAGMQLSFVYFYTNYTVTSSNYTQFTVLAGNKLYQTGTVFYIGLAQGSTPPPAAYNAAYTTGTVCGVLTGQLQANSAVQNVGTQYNLGTLFGGNAGQVAALPASQLLSWASTGGCNGLGTNYWIYFLVQLQVQAVGQGTLPTATYLKVGYFSTTISVGSITVTGSVTGHTYAIPVPIPQLAGVDVSRRY